MSTPIRMILTQKICSLFPLVVSQQLRSLLYPRKLARKKAVDFRKKSITGSYFESNTKDFHSYSFFFHGFFDWRNIVIANAAAKGNNGDIIEIGANIGTETISYCDIVGQHKVHAFEPLPSNLKDLRKIEANQPSLKLYDVAISDKVEEVSFLVPPETASGIGKVIDTEKHSNEETITVKTAELDSFLENFTNVNFMSIDTEGHEPFVLNGAKETFKKFKPTVVIEVSPVLLEKYADSDSTFIYNFFKQLNYKMFKITKFTFDEVREEDLTTIKQNNWICIPEGNKKLENQIRKDLLLRFLVPFYLLRKLPSN